MLRCAAQEQAASGDEGDAQLAVTVLRQDMQERTDALEASRDQLRLRDEEVQDLAQHLRAAQADIASLQVCAECLPGDQMPGSASTHYEACMAAFATHLLHLIPIHTVYNGPCACSTAAPCANLHVCAWVCEHV